MNERVAIVEDEPDLARLAAAALAKEGFRVDIHLEGGSFLRGLEKSRPDIVLLDLMLPDISGLDVCRKLKSSDEWRSIPIIMVTARGEESDRVLGLELGADDYVVKPVSFKELAARVRAILRRAAPSAAAPLLSAGGGEIEIDTERHEVRVRGDAVPLTSTEFNILHLLAKRPGRVFTRDQILDHLWGHDKIVLDRTVDVHIKNLRLKLGPAAAKVQNVRGVGYKVDP